MRLAIGTGCEILVVEWTSLDRGGIDKLHASVGSLYLGRNRDHGRFLSHQPPR